METFDELIHKLKENEELKNENLTLYELKEQILIEGIVPKIMLELDSEIELVESYINETRSLLISNGMPEDNINEGFLGKLVGGAAGFLIGPKIGRVVARALGIEKGVMYDMLTSKLVGTALGVSITKSFSRR